MLHQRIKLPLYHLIPREALFWMAALFCLAWLTPEAEHFTLCLFSLAGLDFCPGCGLGRSIALLFQGEHRESFAVHPLGLPAVLVLGHRIISLFSKTYQNYGKNYRPSA